MTSIEYSTHLSTNDAAKRNAPAGFFANVSLLPPQAPYDFHNQPAPWRSIAPTPNQTDLKQQHLAQICATRLRDENHGIILSLPVGSGKTRAGVVAAQEAAQENTMVLVTAPAAVLGQWMKEVNLLYPQIPCAIGGTDKQIRQFYQLHQGSRCFLFVSHHRMRTLPLKPSTWGLMVIDEVHKIKNPSSQVYKAVAKDKRPKLGLTATPIVGDARYSFVPTSVIVDPSLGDYKGQEKDWVKYYVPRMTLTIQMDVPKLPENQVQLFLEFSPEDNTAYTNAVADMERSFADWMRVREDPHQVALATLLKEKYISDVDVLRQMSAYSRLRELNAARDKYLKDVRAGTVEKTEVPPYVMHFPLDVKLETMLHGTLKSLRTRKSQVAMCSYLGPMELLKYHLGLHGVKAEIYSGELSVGQRCAMMDRFREASFKPLDQLTDQDTRILLISARTGGAGLNVDFVDTMAFLDTPINWSIDEQQRGRINRRSQTAQKLTYIYYKYVGSTDMIDLSDRWRSEKTTIAAMTETNEQPDEYNSEVVVKTYGGDNFLKATALWKSLNVPPLTPTSNWLDHIKSCQQFAREFSSKPQVPQTATWKQIRSGRNKAKKAAKSASKPISKCK